MFSIAHHAIVPGSLDTEVSRVSYFNEHNEERMMLCMRLALNARAEVLPGGPELMHRVRRLTQPLGQVRVQPYFLGAWYRGSVESVTDVEGGPVHLTLLVEPVPREAGWIEFEELPSEVAAPASHYTYADIHQERMCGCVRQLDLSDHCHLLVGVDAANNLLLRNISDQPCPIEVTVMLANRRMVSRLAVHPGAALNTGFSLDAAQSIDVGAALALDIQRIENGLQLSRVIAEVDNVWLVHRPDRFLCMENRNAAPVQARLMLGRSMLCSARIPPYQEMAVAGIQFEEPEQNGMELQVCGEHEAFEERIEAAPITGTRQHPMSALRQSEAQEMNRRAAELRREAAEQAQPPVPQRNPVAEVARVSNLDAVFPEAIARFNRTQVTHLMNWVGLQPEPLVKARRLQIYLNNTDYSVEALNAVLGEMGVPQTLWLVEPDTPGSLRVDDAVNRLVEAAYGRTSVPMQTYGREQVHHLIEQLIQAQRASIITAEQLIGLLREFHTLRPAVMNDRLRDLGVGFNLEQQLVPEAFGHVPARGRTPTTLNTGTVKRRLEFDGDA